MAITAEELFRSHVDNCTRLVDQAAGLLHAAGPQGLSPRGGRWTAPEILGHLWDSAQLNHLRLLRSLDGEDLLFPGYDQDRWVALQEPAGLPWGCLVEGWRCANLRLLHLLDRLDPALRTRPHARHSLDRIGWQPFLAGEPASLEDLARDYLGHLLHHLRRLEPQLVPPLPLAPGLGRAGLPLETARLRLRAFREDDLNALAPILADPEVVRYLPGPPRTREQSARTLAWFRNQQERDGCSAWALETRAEGRLIGWCGLAEFDNTGEVELLYCLEPGSWGQGLASEAARACVDCAREGLGLPRLIAAVLPENKASRRVLEKSGLSYWKPGRWFGLELDMYRLEFRP
ncbi:MAG: GNAT family N-acetyltransferase [Candidatus Delongbacteria bacterium]